MSETQHISAIALMNLLQLASPSLPVGAYSYSEGLEYLVEAGKITTAQALQDWLEYELAYGSIRMESAVLVRVHQALLAGDRKQVQYWNAWLSAGRETAELRSQSWQMGHSLLQLLQRLPLAISLDPVLLEQLETGKCNFAIAFAIAAYGSGIPCEAIIISYMHSWASNLVSAGIKLIPLGQTAGQQIIFQLHTHIAKVVPAILVLPDEDLAACTWGLALASMAHETQYTRLFRS